jgi:hypothetical protein
MDVRKVPGSMWNTGRKGGQMMGAAQPLVLFGGGGQALSALLIFCLGQSRRSCACPVFLFSS